MELSISMNTNNGRTNDLSQLPVDLNDDGVNYGIIYNFRASEDILQAIITMLEGFCALSTTDSTNCEDIERGIYIPISEILDNENFEGILIGYTLENHILELVTICRGNVIEPFIDSMYEKFPLIDYIEVYNEF